MLLAAGLGGLLAGCGGDSESPEGRDIVRLDGSSTVFPVAEAVAEEFQAATQGRIRVTVGISGTGGGFKKFTRGETDVQNASRPILSEEMTVAEQNGVEYIEAPICFDALTVVVNPDNDWVDHLTVSELKRIWEPSAQGTLTRWSQVRPGWPDEPIVLYGPGSDSGTFDYFTEAVVGEAKSSRGDYTASEDDNVLVRGVAGNRWALGYLPFAYYEPNKETLRAVPIAWDINSATGEEIGAEPVLPSLDAVVQGEYAPLARPLFMYVRAQALDVPAVNQFVDFYLDNASELAREVDYLPLPDWAIEYAKEKMEQRITGTAFGGHPPVGLSVEELLAVETSAGE